MFCLFLTVVFARIDHAFPAAALQAQLVHVHVAVHAAPTSPGGRWPAVEQAALGAPGSMCRRRCTPGERRCSGLPRWPRTSCTVGISDFFFFFIVSLLLAQLRLASHVFNLLDTPGHEDFSEDTYRTLTAVDSAVMVIDAAKGIEARTRKLFEVCRLRDIPILTFINKMDRESRDPFDLLDEIEKTLALDTTPVNWPVGRGRDFVGTIAVEGGGVRLLEGDAGKAGTLARDEHRGGRGAQPQSRRRRDRRGVRAGARRLQAVRSGRRSARAISARCSSARR